MVILIVGSLWDTVTLKTLGSGLTGASITDNKQVQCASWDTICRWGNSPANDFNWQQATGKIDDKLWVEKTGSNQAPPS